DQPVRLPPDSRVSAARHGAVEELAGAALQHPESRHRAARRALEELRVPRARLLPLQSHLRPPAVPQALAAARGAMACGQVTAEEGERRLRAGRARLHVNTDTGVLRQMLNNLYDRRFVLSNKL